MVNHFLSILATHMTTLAGWAEINESVTAQEKHGSSDQTIFTNSVFMKSIFHAISWVPSAAVAALFLGGPSLFAQGWQALPNTKLQSVCPPNNFQPVGGGMPAYNFSDHCHYVINAWNGGAADTKRNRLIIWGGGHVAYHGNEVYSLDLSTVTPGAKARTNSVAPTMQRLNDPSIFIPTSPQPIRQPDGTPVARHTYGGFLYLPKADKIFAWNGPDYFAGDPGSLTQYRNVWLLNMSTLAWEEKLPGGYNVAGVPYGPVTATCALDPTTANESVLCIWGHTYLLRYNVDGPAANTWEQLVPYGSFSGVPGGTVTHGGSAVADPDRKLLYQIGPNSYVANSSGKILAIDLTRPGYPVKDLTATSTGCGPLISAPFPGVVYDAEMRKVVGYPNYGNTVYIYDPDTNSCTSQTFQGGPAGSSGQNANGIFGRFSYFPSLGKYVVANNPGGDAYTLALGTGGTTPPPAADTTAPVVSFTAPTGGATVSGTVTVSANATDDIGVASVQFILDGVNLGSAVTAAPYSISWNTTTVPDGVHTLTAIAKDMAGNSATATGLTVSVSNAITTPIPPPTITGLINGLGQSTITCLDKDGDRHGVGPGCTARDADDNDPTVRTGPEAIEKYGSLKAFLSHLGYNPTRIWYIAPATATPPGNNSTGAVDDPSRPFLDWAGVVSKLAAGDIVMLRNGTYSFWAMGVQNIGTATKPLVIMSYPGELASFKTYPSGFDMVGASNVVLDGMLFYKSGGNAGVQAGNNTNVVFRHIDSSGGKWGMVASNLNNVTIEDSVFHDNPGEHGIYLANHKSTASVNVTVRRNLLYNNAYTGIQCNGRMKYLLIEQNMAYNNALSGFSWLTGVSYSVLRGNVAFNNGQAGLTLFNYTAFCDAYDPGGVGSTCPYDQNYNLIENFTVFNTGRDPSDGSSNVAAQAAVRIGNSSLNKVGDMGHNTFRNIVASVPGVGNQYQPFVFLDTDRDYLATSVFENIVFNQLDMGSGVGSAVIGFGYSSSFGYNPYSCTQAQTVTKMTNCINADPKFVSASTSYWNSPSSFDLRLQSSSPAIRAGKSVGAKYDVVGIPFADPPSMGAYEFSGSTPAPETGSPCDVDRDGLLSASDVQAAVNQSLAVAGCGTADVSQDGQCNIIDVQRVVNATTGGVCKVGL